MNKPKIFRNLPPAQLIDLAVSRGEGILASNKALCVQTGPRTGRSPKDRFIVRDAITADTVAWNTINQPIDPECFDKLWHRVTEYLNKKESLYVEDLFVGSDPDYQLSLDLTSETAWQALFAQDLFITEGERCGHTHSSLMKGRWQVISAPSFKTDPVRDGVHSDAVIILNFTKCRLLICGTHYAGEMKKGMFSVLNFLLPPKGVLPMHCSANQGKEGDVALFFGLSGTGKTTLSADPDRLLIGDDEHGWGPEGVFNFEGGCYAKCINLSRKNEPIIWDAIRFGSVMENVVLDPQTKEPKFEDASLTENTRAAYPLSFIENRVHVEKAGHPQNLVFLSCDLYGVLPPVARLTPEQAAYYFLSGYTALVGSTEVGSESAIKPTFSACFGAPFFSRPATEYAYLLINHINKTNARVYLVNTGWTGGPYGEGGTRFTIPTTRGVINSILNGLLHDAPYKTIPRFGFEIPDLLLPGIDSRLLDPEKSWVSPEEYPHYAAQLIEEFQKNFEKFNCPEIKVAGPI